MAITPQDREILRTLAAQVRTITELPEMHIRRQRWYDHNDLTPQRPMILCFPEGAWSEILPRDQACQCTDPLLRSWEWTLRSKLFWWNHLRDDHVLTPFFDIPWAVSKGDFGVDVPYEHGANRGSFVWQAPLKNFPEDIAKLKFRALSVEREKTHQQLELATSLFGDLLTPRIRGSYWWTMGMTIELIRLVGLEQLMVLMCDQPEAVHQLMAFLRDEHLHFLNWFEKEGLLSSMNGPNYTGSGGVGFTRQLPGNPDETAFTPMKLRDLWGFSESQETVGISPDMFGEFIFPYQLPLLEKFGLNCYGCCEPVHARIGYIEQIPRLRRVSVSPWADQQIMADRLYKKAVFSRKPNPTLVCAPTFDEALIREDIRQTLNIAGQCSLEIIMKDTHTVHHDYKRLTRWIEIGLEEVERYMNDRK